MNSINYRSKILSFCSTTVIILTFILLCWMVFANFFSQTNCPEGLFVLFCVFLVLMWICVYPNSARRFRGYIEKTTNNTRFIVALFCCVFVVGSVARFSFLFFSYDPTSDPATFYNTAMTIVETGNMQGDTYVGRFPYTGAYDMLLSLVLSIFPSHMGIIILNTICDTMAMLFLAVLVQLFTHDMRYSFLAALIWWISPFNIVFCALSLPVIVVNTFIMLILLLFVLVLKYLCLPLVAASFGLLAGLAMGIANSFRPLMAVFAIALIVFLIVKCCITNRNRRKKIIGSVLAIIAMLLMLNCVNFAYTKIITNETGLEPNTSGAGWSIFVGSNYESWGCWNKTDSQYFAELLHEQYSGDYSAATMQLQHEGINRWQSLGPFGATELVLRKSVKLLGDQQNMIYNLETSYPFFGEHKQAMHIMHVLCAFWWFIILGLNIVFAYKRVKLRNKHDVRWNCVSLFQISMIGLVFAYLLVEVSNRYFTVFFPMMVFEAIISLYFCLNSSSQSKNQKYKSSQNGNVPLNLEKPSKGNQIAYLKETIQDFLDCLDFRHFAKR